MKHLHLFAFLIVLVAAAPLGAQEIEYEKYVLENGLTVILHEDHSLPVVCINTWYYVGAKDEPKGRSGFAHYFEHLMFMGTTRVPDNQFDVLMEKGGGWNNASTGRDRTNYYSVGPSSLLPTLLWLDADRMEDVGPAMNREKLDKQRGVVQNEKREGEEMQPYGMAEFSINSLMYPPGHPYHIGIIGTHADIEAATVRDVKDFFAQYYVPNNASLVVAGDFDPEEIKPLVARLFGTLPRRPDPVHAVAEPVRLDGVKRVTYADDVQFSRLYYVYHSPPTFQPGDAEMDLIAELLTSGKSSRLYKKLIYDEKLATDVSAFQWSCELGSSFYVVITAAQGVSLDTIEEAADRAIADFVREGPDREELERHKASYEYYIVNGLQSVRGKADRLNRYDRYLGEPNSFKWDLDRYRNATEESVRDWARDILTPDARLVMRVLPEEEAAKAGGRDECPSAFDAREFTAVEPETFTLSNGIKVSHWQRSELPLVEVSLFLPFGSFHMDRDHPGRAALTADMLNEGAGERDALEFSNALDHLGASFNAHVGREFTTVNLHVLKRNLDEAMKLYADGILRPRFDEKEWDRVRKLHIERLQQGEDRPGVVAARVAERVFFGKDHPYGSPVDGTVEDVETLPFEMIRSAHMKYFITGNAEFFTAGDLTAGETRDALESVFGGWEKRPPSISRRITLEWLKPANQYLRVVYVDKEDATQTVIRFIMPGFRYRDPYRVSHELLNTIFGGSFTSRLNQNLREDHGYTYGAGSRMNMNRSVGYTIAAATVQADVTGAAIGEFLKEFERIRAGDVTEEEAMKTRETNRMDAIESFQGLNGLIRTAEELALNRLPFSTIGDDLNRIASITEDDLNAVASAAFPMEEALLVLVGDREVIMEQLAGLGLPTPTELTVRGEKK